MTDAHCRENEWREKNHGCAADTQTRAGNRDGGGHRQRPSGPTRTGRDRGTGGRPPSDPDFSLKTNIIYRIIKAAHHLKNVTAPEPPTSITRMTLSLSSFIKPAAPNTAILTLIEGNAKYWQQNTMLMLRDHYHDSMENDIQKLSQLSLTDWGHNLDVAAAWARRHFRRRLHKSTVDSTRATLTQRLPATPTQPETTEGTQRPRTSTAALTYSQVVSKTVQPPAAIQRTTEEDTPRPTTPTPRRTSTAAQTFSQVVSKVLQLPTKEATRRPTALQPLPATGRMLQKEAEPEQQQPRRDEENNQSHRNYLINLLADRRKSKAAPAALQPTAQEATPQPTAPQPSPATGRMLQRKAEPERQQPRRDEEESWPSLPSPPSTSSSLSLSPPLSLSSFSPHPSSLSSPPPPPSSLSPPSPSPHPSTSPSPLSPTPPPSSLSPPTLSPVEEWKRPPWKFRTLGANEMPEEKAEGWRALQLPLLLEQWEVTKRRTHRRPRRSPLRKPKTETRAHSRMFPTLLSEGLCKCAA